jgi:hypothetical protein
MKKILLLVLALMATQANATIISADFTASTDNQFCCQSQQQGALVLQALGQAVGAGVELGAGAAMSNPSGWLGGVVWIDLDPVARTLTLLSQDDFDFDTFSASISNIHFSGNEVITGLSRISDDLTADLMDSSALMPTFSFSGNSLQIDYLAPGGFYFTRGSAVFQFTTEASTAAVPEPATAGLFALGLLGLLGMRRRVRTLAPVC